MARTSVETPRPIATTPQSGLYLDATRTTVQMLAGNVAVQEPVRQSAAGESPFVSGAVVIECSLPSLVNTRAFDFEVEQHSGGQGWAPFPQADLAIGFEPGEPSCDGDRVVLLTRRGWRRGAEYRAHFTYTFTSDRWGADPRQKSFPAHPVRRGPRAGGCDPGCFS